MREALNLACCLLTTVLLTGCHSASTSESSNDQNSSRQESETQGESHEARLAGEYISDLDATMAFFESTGNFDSEQLEIVRNSFGQTRITFEGDQLTMEHEGEIGNHRFKILESDGSNIVIECSLTAEEKALLSADSLSYRIELTDDGFWLGNAIAPSDRFKEKFVRTSSD